MTDKDENKIYSELGKMNSGISGINSRLDRLNGSVAKQEQKIENLRIQDGNFESRIQAVEEFNRKQQDSHDYWKRFWIERSLLVIFALSGWVLYLTGIITIPAL